MLLVLAGQFLSYPRLRKQLFYMVRNNQRVYFPIEYAVLPVGYIPLTPGKTGQSQIPFSVMYLSYRIAKGRRNLPLLDFFQVILQLVLQFDMFQLYNEACLTTLLFICLNYSQCNPNCYFTVAFTA